MSQYNKYKIYCITESAWIYQYTNSAPTVCPNNVGHTVNSNSITVCDDGYKVITTSYSIDGANDTYIEFTGSTILQTITFPSVDITNVLKKIVVINSGSVAVGLSGVQASISLGAGSGITVKSNSNKWIII